MACIHAIAPSTWAFDEARSELSRKYHDLDTSQVVCPLPLTGKEATARCGGRGYAQGNEATGYDIGPGAYPTYISWGHVIPTPTPPWTRRASWRGVSVPRGVRPGALFPGGRWQVLASLVAHTFRYDPPVFFQRLRAFGEGILRHKYVLSLREGLDPSPHRRNAYIIWTSGSQLPTKAGSAR